MDSPPPPLASSSPRLPPPALLCHGRADGGADTAPSDQATDEPMEMRTPPPAVPAVPLPPARPRPRPLYTVETIFREFTFRRTALVRALTTDEEELFRRCDSGSQFLYLYGNTKGSWEVRRPELYVPLDRPEPMLGINIVRDKMKRLEWLEQIAMHCDAWLINISFLGPYLDARERQRLFTMINGLPTVHETFVASDTYRRLCHLEKKRSSGVVEDKDDVCCEDKTFCASCGDRYHANGFWICCDDCERWFHGKCVKITADKAERIEHYECPECSSEKTGHDYDADPVLSDLFRRY